MVAFIPGAVYMSTKNCVAKNLLWVLISQTLVYMKFNSKIFKLGARRPHAWFLKIDPVQIVCMCVYVCVRPEAINN